MRSVLSANRNSQLEASEQTNGFQSDSQILVERRLVDRLVAGDPKAPEEFVRLFGRLIYATLRTGRYCPEDIEDLYQSTYLHLWKDHFRPLRQWRGDCKLSTYISVVVSRLASGYLRKGVTTPARITSGSSLAISYEDVNEIAESQVDPAPGPEDVIVSEERRRLLVSTMERLPARDVAILSLRYGKALTYREIAESLGLTICNVGVALARAETRLRNKIVAEHPDVFDLDNERPASIYSPRPTVETPRTGSGGITCPV